MRRPTTRLLSASGKDVSWFTWFAFLAFMITGAVLRGVFPEASVAPLAGAVIAAFVVGTVVYRWEFSREDAVP